MPRWKNILKVIFDEAHESYQFIVTGSAKLNILKRAGDSLAGRYFTFHLHPLILNEVDSKRKTLHRLGSNAAEFIQSRLDATLFSQEALLDLMEYSGFSEPFLRQASIFLISGQKIFSFYIDDVFFSKKFLSIHFTERVELHRLPL